MKSNIITKNNTFVYIFSIIIQFIILYLLIYKWDPLSIKNKYPFTFIIPLFLICLGCIELILFGFIKKRNKLIELNRHSLQTQYEIPTLGNFMTKVILTLISIVGLIAICWISVLLIYHFPKLNNFFIFILNVCIVVTIIAFIYKVLNLSFIHNKLIKYPILNYIKNIILLIPSLIIIFIDKLKTEIKTTTNTTWILFLMSLGFICIRIIVPILINYLKPFSGKVELLKNPIYLDNNTILGNHKVLFPKDKISYTYSISLQLWVIAEPPNTSKKYSNEINILNFGELPKIVYNPSLNILTVKCKKNKNIINQKIEETIIYNGNILLQKWNHIVINYDKGTIDIFINGELVGTSGNISPYIKFEPLIIGERKGLQGSIKEVTYKNEILTTKEIRDYYQRIE